MTSVCVEYLRSGGWSLLDPVADHAWTAGVLGTVGSALLTSGWAPTLIMASLTTAAVATSQRERILRALLSNMDWLKRPKDWKSIVQFKLVGLFSALKKGTYEFQRTLPERPLPDLQNTLAKWREFVRPFLSQDEFEEAEEHLQQFQQNEGGVLQNALRSYSNAGEDWVDELWVKFAYLMQRVPLPLSSNWYLIDGVLSRTYGSSERRRIRAAHLIHGILQFRNRLERGAVSPKKAGGLIPMCMEQTKQLLSTTRVPGMACDELVTTQGASHVVVALNGRFYKMTLHNGDAPISLADIWARLGRIEILDAEATDPPAGVNRLTHQDRKAWAADRIRLQLSEHNGKTLKVIEEALAVIGLDQQASQTMEARAQEVLFNPQNRWYDKSLCFSVNQMGDLGLNAESSAVDKTIVSEFYSDYLEGEEEAYRREGEGFVHLPAPDLGDSEGVEALTWQLNRYLSEKIKTVQNAFEKERSRKDLAVMCFKDFGDGFLKSQGVSSDAFVQMAIQLAFYKRDRDPALTCEVVSTRLFEKGRSDVVRTVSESSVAFIQGMVDPEASREEKLRRLQIACASHLQSTLEAIAGQGVDRHLAGLKIEAHRQSISPELFKSKGFNLDWKLATSHIPCSRSFGGGFHPIAKSGFGIGYTIHDRQMTFHILCNKVSIKTDAAQFRDALKESLEEMRGLWD